MWKISLFLATVVASTFDTCRRHPGFLNSCLFVRLLVCSYSLGFFGSWALQKMPSEHDLIWAALLWMKSLLQGSSSNITLCLWWWYLLILIPLNINFLLWMDGKYRVPVDILCGHPWDHITTSLSEDECSVFSEKQKRHFLGMPFYLDLKFQLYLNYKLKFCLTVENNLEQKFPFLKPTIPYIFQFLFWLVFVPQSLCHILLHSFVKLKVTTSYNMKRKGLCVLDVRTHFIKLI